jgi:hypothetical protein
MTDRGCDQKETGAHLGCGKDATIDRKGVHGTGRDLRRIYRGWFCAHNDSLKGRELGRHNERHPGAAVHAAYNGDGPGWHMTGTAMVGDALTLLIWFEYSPTH